MSLDETFLKEQIEALLQRELQYMTSSHHDIFPLWRPKILRWFYQIVDNFEYDRHIVAIATNFMDRALQAWPDAKHMNIDSDTYQLIAMVCLCIALKSYGNEDRAPIITGKSSSPVKQTRAIRKRKVHLDLRSFVELSRGHFEIDDALQMESWILTSLDWKLNPVTPICFLPLFVQILSLQSQETLLTELNLVHELARYFAELSIDLSCDSASLPSIIAYVCIQLALDMISHTKIPIHLKNSFTRQFTPFQNADSGTEVGIKEMIVDRFIPHQSISTPFQSRSAVLQCALELHPVTITRSVDQAMVNDEFIQSLCCLLISKSKSETNTNFLLPSSPTSVLHEDIDNSDCKE